MSIHGLPASSIVDLKSNTSYYATINFQWNLRKEKVYPLAYFLPLTTSDVKHAVRCGVKTQIHLIPNSGASSYEAISFGNNSTLIVDFRNMKKIEIVGSGDKATAVIQPGALVGHVNAYLWSNGGYGMSMGNCMTVGLGGHVTGGGVGYFSALYGLAVDNLLEVELVDAKGNVLIASATRNPQLFWALQGVGPGYIGIVTRMKLKIFQASKNQSTLIKLRYPIKQFVEVWGAFQKWLDWTNENDPSIFSGMIITHGNLEIEIRFRI